CGREEHVEELDEHGAEADECSGEHVALAGYGEHAEAEEESGDDVVLAVDGDELQADGAGDVEHGGDADGALGGEEARGAEPDGEGEELNEDGEKDDCERRVPETKDRCVKEGVERGVAGWEVAIRELMLEQQVGFGDVERGNVAAHGKVKHEEDTEEDREARQDEGNVDGAVEGGMSGAVDGFAGGREETNDGERAAECNAGLKALDSSHPMVRPARECMGRVYGRASESLIRAGVTCMVQ